MSPDFERRGLVQIRILHKCLKVFLRWFYCTSPTSPTKSVAKPVPWGILSIFVSTLICYVVTQPCLASPLSAFPLISRASLELVSPDVSPTTTHLPLATLILINQGGFWNIYWGMILAIQTGWRLLLSDEMKVCKDLHCQQYARVSNRQLVMASSARSGASLGLNKELETGPSWS